MVRLLVCTFLLAMSGTAVASPAPIIHVARTPVVTGAHVRTLRVSLASRRLPPGVTLDVSVVNMNATTRGATLQITAEVRGALSDGDGRLRSLSTVRVSVSGPARQRAQLENDLLDEAARRLAHTLTRSSPS